jgi:dienelactone hydrolase
MKRKTVVSFLLASFVTASVAYAAESVSFKGTSKTGDEFVLKGVLNKPSGQGPFPALVMLSGGKGWKSTKEIAEAWNKWVERFNKWGYVALQVETLASRGRSSIFDDGGSWPTLSPREAAQDAHDAKAYLRGLPYVDGKKVFLIGWFYGGWAVPYAIDPSAPIRNRGSPFRAAIAFDPYCDQPLMGYDTPFLILHGELDDWHHVARCRIIEGRSEHEITLKIYPGAYMAFDLEGVDTTSDGHRLLYNPAAAADAVEQVRNFLFKHGK